MTVEQPAGQPAKQGNSGVLWVIGIVVVFGLCLGGVALRDGGSDDPGPDAERVCQDFVKKRLKSPSSADFSDVDHTSAGDTYTVTGSVDSQNSFGAMIRSNFTCTVHDDGDQWSLTSISGIN